VKFSFSPYFLFFISLVRSFLDKEYMLSFWLSTDVKVLELFTSI